MALTQVRAPQQGQEVVGVKKGGGSTGAAIGAVIGGVAGGIAGYASGNVPGAIVGATSGAGGGGALGEKIGNAVDKPSQGTAIDRRVASQAAPEMYHSERSDALRQSLVALNNAPPEMQQQYGGHLVSAYLSSLANDHTGLAMPGEQQQPPAGVA